MPPENGAKGPPILESVATVALLLVECYVLLDQNERRNGGEGFAPALKKYRDRYVKLWHYPERWRRAKRDLVVEATLIKMQAAGEL